MSEQMNGREREEEFRQELEFKMPGPGPEAEFEDTEPAQTGARPPALTEERPRRGGAMPEFFDWVESMTVAVVCVVLVFTFVLGMNVVDGESMVPTLQNNDRLLVRQLLYEPVPGDIVVVTKPVGLPGALVKRVIAVGGQTIDIDFDRGVVTVDGQVLDEPYIAERTHTSYDLEFPQTVPEGHVFVMGDNRNGSWDSRAADVGMVDRRYVTGKVVFRIMPLGAIGVPQ